VTAALPLALALLASAAGAPAPELEPYRALARDAAAREAVLAAARAGLAGALGDSAASAPPAGVPEWPGSPRPLYVTLAHGHATRACVGADVPPAGSLAASLAALGAQLADRDLRRPPVRAAELDTLRLVVAFAADPVPVADPMAVDPMREGLKIETERGAVAFLPGEARTVSWALREARRIGVLTGPVSDARCSRFSVVTFQGPAAARPATAQEPSP
jgi:AMMECR1 domain-containing protein